MAKMLLISRGGMPAQQQSMEPMQEAPRAPKVVEPISQAPEPANPLVRGAFALGRGTIDLPWNIENVARTVTHPLLGYENVETPTQQLQKKLGYTNEQLEPQGFVESAAHKLAEVAPLGIATGGTGALGRLAAGSAVGAGIKELGAPGLIQDIGQLATEIGTGAYKGRLPTVGKKIAAHETFAAGAVKPSERHLGEHISNVIQGIKNKLGTEVSEQVITKVNHAVDSIEKNMMHFGKEKFYNPSTLRNIRKNLHGLYEEMPSQAKPYVTELTKGINKQFAINMAENPEFFDNLRNKADKLTEMKNMKGVVERFVEDQPILQKVFKKTAGIPEGVINFLTKPLTSLEKIIRMPTARDHYFDMIKAVGQEDPGTFLKALGALNDEIEEAPLPKETKKKAPTKAPSSGKMKLISRAH